MPALLAAADLLSLNGVIIVLAVTAVILGALGKVQAAVICLGVSVVLIVVR